MNISEQLADIRAKVDDLNQTSDNFKAAFLEVERKLDGVGVKTSIKFPGGTLWYGRYYGRFKLMVNKKPVIECSREQLIGAYGHLPRLLTSIQLRIKEQLSNAKAREQNVQSGVAERERPGHHPQRHPSK